MSDEAAPRPSGGERDDRTGWRSVLVAVALAAAVTALVLMARAPAEAAPVAQAGTTVPTAEAPALSGTEQPTAFRADASPEQLAAGQQLYLTSCVSCHGVGGVGTVDGPSLLASGEAQTDFYLRTGRMPLAAPVPQPPSKPVAYSDDEIRALVAYVGSLCDRSNLDCPPIPAVDTESVTLEQGSALYLANCAPCHGSVAVGGALSYGRHAPSLQETPPLQVAEAIRTGPGQMPRFGHDVFTDEQVNAIVKYVTYLQEPEHPGGLSLGYTGPVAEGFVALLVGLGALILGIRWITREPDQPDDTHSSGRPDDGEPDEPGADDESSEAVPA